MTPNSETVNEINDLFYDRSKTIKIVSFYESRGMRGLNDVHIFPREHTSAATDLHRLSFRETRQSWRMKGVDHSMETI